MLSTLENERLHKEELQLGKTLADFMTTEVIGIFTVHEETDFAKWLKLNFHSLKYKKSRLFDPTDNGIERDQDPMTYEKILMLEVKFSQERNHIKTRKASLIDFGYDKFIPVLHIIFEVDLNKDDKKIFQADRIRDRLLVWKRYENDS